MLEGSDGPQLSHGSFELGRLLQHASHRLALMYSSFSRSRLTGWLPANWGACPWYCRLGGLAPGGQVWGSWGTRVDEGKERGGCSAAKRDVRRMGCSDTETEA